MDDTWDTGYISRYTRADAIADGILVDVSAMAKEGGFKVPVAITQAVWGDFINPRVIAIGQSVDGRLWDVLWMAYNAARNNKESSETLFTVAFFMPCLRHLDVQLKLTIGPGDEGEPVATISFPEED